MSQFNRVIIVGFCAADVLAWTSLFGQKIGEAPKNALNPKTYAQIAGLPSPTMAEQHAKIETQIAVMAQRIEDLSHRLDLHRTEIDALQPEIVTAKLAKMELELQAMEDEKRQRAAAAKADHDALMGWLRGIGGGIVTCVFGIGINGGLAFVREKRRGAAMAVLTEHTDGMVKKISDLAEMKGHADERAAQGNP